MRQLVETGADVAVTSLTRTVRQLVKAGADVTVTDLHGQAPLILACRSDVDAKQKAAYLLQCDASLLSVRDVING